MFIHKGAFEWQWKIAWEGGGEDDTLKPSRLLRPVTSSAGAEVGAELDGAAAEGSDANVQARRQGGRFAGAGGAGGKGLGVGKAWGMRLDDDHWKVCRSVGVGEERGGWCMREGGRGGRGIGGGRGR